MIEVVKLEILLLKLIQLVKLNVGKFNSYRTKTIVYK